MKVKEGAPLGTEKLPTVSDSWKTETGSKSVDCKVAFTSVP